jgi:hypothetical protein
MKDRVLRIIYTCENINQLLSAIRYAELAGFSGDPLVDKAVRIKRHELMG